MDGNKIDFSIFKLKKELLVSKLIFSLVSLWFIGTAIAFNNLAGLGNDPISVFLDGVRNLIADISPIDDVNDLAVATNLVSIILFVLILIIRRKYINIGTLIYTLLLGSFIGFGIKLYSLLGFKISSQNSMQILTNLFSGTGINVSEFTFQCIISTVACLFLFWGIAMFISINIGLDPFTGVAMVLSDFIKKPYKITKVILDLLFLILGWIFGGEVGFVTIVAAFLGGPVINKFVLLLNKTRLKTFNSESSSNS